MSSPSIKSLIATLKARDMKLTTAESCTGGILAHFIIQQPGVSSVFDRGFITYSNVAKMEELGVPAALLDTYGAVSDECAVAMAEGALSNSNAEIAVSVTGIAGPDGGSKEKPVGLVYIGIATQGGSTSTENDFTGSRLDIQTQTAHKAIELLLEALS